MAGHPKPGSALRRLILVGVVYAALAWFLGLPLVGAMARAFLLPPSFVPLARGLLVVVGVVLLLAVWRDPGTAEGTDRRGEDRGG